VETIHDTSGVMIVGIETEV